jgi:phosphoribosylformylglycinamidine synthase PurS subunit
MNCICRNRELVMELPDNAFSVRCAGCHGTVYGLEKEDCRQVRLPNMYKAIITLKPGILDNAGNAVTHALKYLGFSEVNSVRIGKILEYNADSLEQAIEIAESQTNEVMEDHSVTEITESQFKTIS